jgi:DtxR family transcriptional regulator, Mn-dependent transcriptional regulator
MTSTQMRRQPRRSILGMEEEGPRLRRETVEHYLETIFYIAHEGEVVRPGRIAEWQGVGAPTVSATLQRLQRDGWITMEKDRSVATTEQGEALAATVVRHHRLLERWLTDSLGLDWASADEEAQRLAPGLTEEVAERLAAHLGDPHTCPHGNVIPGRPAPYGELVALADLKPGAFATVQRISEVAEHDAPQVLRQLEAFGLVPGATVTIGDGGGGLGAIAVVRGSETVALGLDVARLVWAEPT